VAYWVPPLGAAPFSGSRARALAVVAALRAGGQPARLHPDVPGLVGFPSAIMMAYLLALEAGGWRLDGLGRMGGRAGQAAREAIAVVARRVQRRPLLIGLASRPFTVRAGLWLGRRVIPLDLETYLREHFTKVGDQTRLMVAQYIDAGRASGLPVAALEGLRDAAGALPGKSLAAS
jgi:2-dehydropantoate 2-reductase